MTLSTPATLTQFERLGDRYGILRLKPNTEHWSHRPGQYTQISFANRDGSASFTKIYSIASAMRDDHVLDFCVQLNDPQLVEVSASWVEGQTQLLLTEAAGKFYVPPYTSPAILLAGGSGVTPLKAILEDRLKNGDSKTPTILLYGCGDDAEMPFHDEFQELASKHAQFTVRFFAEVRRDKSRAEVGRPLAVLPSILIPAAEYLMCGPPPFMDAARTLLTDAGIPPEQIHQDRY